MTKFYVDAQGRYIGGFDGSEPPDGAIEVVNPPNNGTDIWLNGAWSIAQVVPQEITSRQAHAALIKRGLDVSIDAYIDAIPDPVQKKLVRNEYVQSKTWERHWPLVIQIGAALGLDLDELFVFASTL